MTLFGVPQVIVPAGIGVSAAALPVGREVGTVLLLYVSVQVVLRPKRCTAPADIARK